MVTECQWFWDIVYEIFELGLVRAIRVLNFLRCLAFILYLHVFSLFLPLSSTFTSTFLSHPANSSPHPIISPFFTSIRIIGRRKEEEEATKRREEWKGNKIGKARGTGSRLKWIREVVGSVDVSGTDPTSNLNAVLLFFFVHIADMLSRLSNSYKRVVTGKGMLSSL